MKTINERVNEVVKIAISDNNALKMQDTKKRIEKELSENVEFQELVKAVNDFRLSYYNGDTEYKEVASANVRAAFRACSKMVKGIDIPFDYTNCDENVEKILQSSMVDTDARLASVICNVNKRFEIRINKTAKLPTFEEWSEEEKTQILSLVDLGILTKEEAETKINNGKLKK